MLHFIIQPMRKSLLVAASLTAAASATTFADIAKAAPQFKVTAASPGAIDFTGNGTAQFNNSIGTNNSFQVGSSTNLGVNASASSTPEYGVTGVARLDLAGTTTMKQVIGTSGATQSSTNTATAAYTVAHSRASERATSKASEAQSSWEADAGASWSAYRSNAAAHGGTYDSASDSVSFASAGSNSHEYKNEREWKASRTSTRTAAYDASYNTEYNSEFTRAHSQIKQSETAQSDSGTIKGTFKTEEYGSAQSAGSQSDWSTSAKSDAKVAAEASYGSSWDAYRSNSSGTYGTSAGVSSEAEWSREYNNAYNNEYSRSYATAAAGAARSSDSSVEVNGIGSDANIAANPTSTFDVEIKESTLPSGFSLGSTATANGSAGANLATSSFANQSQSSTASGFMQAFGGDEGGGVVSGTTTASGTYETNSVTTLTPGT